MPTTKAAPRRGNVRGHGIGGQIRMQGQGYCECGCGQRTRLAYRTDAARGWRKGEPMRFVNRHRIPPFGHGAQNPNYQGGLFFYKGRWLATCRDGSKMAYARVVMAAHIGRLLRSDEIVHHRDEDPANDVLTNLQIVTRAEHIRIHAALRRARRAT